MAANKMDLAAVRGRMGSRDYYVVMFPLGLVARYFKFHDWAEMPPEQRAQRQLSDKRVPEIARYILDHEDDWVFSSLTASFDAKEEFLPSDLDPSLGVLRLPLSAEFLLNDGQHRRAALELALQEDRTLEEQSISVVLFPMETLERSQQVFSDLNRTVHKTSRSLDILYDHRDPLNALTIAVSEAVPLFKGRVEKDRVSVAQKSAKFVALSALYDANKALLGPLPTDAGDQEEAEALAIDFWSTVSGLIPQWDAVSAGESRPAEIRAEYINGHAVAFWALGTTGRTLLDQYPDELEWKQRLSRLADVDWRKTNPDWQGLCMIGTDIITRFQTRVATAKYIQWKLGLIDEPPRKVLGAGAETLAIAPSDESGTPEGAPRPAESGLERLRSSEEVAAETKAIFASLMDHEELEAALGLSTLPLNTKTLRGVLKWATLSFSDVPPIDSKDGSSRARHWAVRRQNTDVLVSALIDVTGATEYDARKCISHNTEKGSVGARPLAELAHLDSGLIYPRAACLTKDNPQYRDLPTWLRANANRPDLAPSADELATAIADLA